MSLTKFNGETNNIQGLADKPTQSASQLKALFDKIGNDIKAYLNNTLTSEVDTALGNKADATQTDYKISSEFTYQDVVVDCPSSSSNPIGTGIESFTKPGGYEVFTANVIGMSSPIGVASIISVSNSQVIVQTLGPYGGYETRVTVRIIFKKTA